MRVTEKTNFDTVRESVNRSKGRMEKLQNQHATLKKLNAPSDDPVASAKVLEMRTDKVNNEQFTMNARLAETFISNSELALSEIGDIVVRAKEIALGQASGASSNEDTRLGVAEEVLQLYQQAVAAANRKVGDRYLFGGYRTQSAPINEQGRYQGDRGQMMIEVGKDIFVAMNVSGLEAFNTQPNQSLDARELNYRSGIDRRPTAESDEGLGGNNANLFNELQNLRIGLLTGDLEGIRSTLESFDALHGRIIAMRAKLGSRVQGIQNTSAALERNNLTNATLSSALEDADLTQVVSDLAKEESIFRSSLASSQRLIQPTLMDFLK